MRPTIALLIAAYALPAHAEWGDVNGKVVLRKKDDIPKLKLRFKKGAEVKDPEVCAKADIPNLSLIISKKTRGIKNVFVYVEKVDAIHPSLKDVPKKPVVLDQKNCIFSPHAFFLRVGQDLQATTQDNCAHNLRDGPFFCKAFNITIVAKSKPVTIPGKVYFAKVEDAPFAFYCDFHKWMKCWAIVLDHPYCAITDENGEFTIKNLPAGRHKLIYWHEAAGYLGKETIRIKAGKKLEADTIEAKRNDFFGKLGLKKSDLLNP